MDVSLSFLIATVGKETLFKTLDSLNPQVQPQDHVYIIFDGRSEIDISRVENYGMVCDKQVIIHPVNLGFWGHGVRNYYQTKLSGDYIHHMDDDDGYYQVLDQVRKDVQENFGKLLIYRFQADGGLIWQTKQITYGQVGTPSGLIPNRPEIMGNWGMHHGGDSVFYNETQDKIGKDNIVFKDTILIRTKPHIRGW